MFVVFSRDFISAEAYLELSEISKVKSFAKVVGNF